MKVKEVNSKSIEMILYGVDKQVGIDITYHFECKTLWLRFLCFSLTIVFRDKGV